MATREGHAPERVRLPLLKTERRVLVAFTDQELRRLIGFKPRTFNHWRVHALAAAPLGTGCRIDEVIKLAVADVDIEDLLLTMYGKGRKEREIPFSLELRKLLFRHGQFKDRHGISSGLLFPTRRGTAWSQRNALRRYYLLLRRLGLPKSGFHCLRHISRPSTCATAGRYFGGRISMRVRCVGLIA